MCSITMRDIPVKFLETSWADLVNAASSSSAVKADCAGGMAICGGGETAAIVPIGLLSNALAATAALPMPGTLTSRLFANTLRACLVS